MSDHRKFGSSNWMLVVAAILLIPFALWSTGVIGTDDEAPRNEPAATPAPAPPTLTPTPTPESAVERSDPDAPIGDEAPPEVAAALARADAGDLPSLGAIWAAGMVHLVGAVPGRAEADAVIAVAELLVGADAVVDAMVLDDRAEPPEVLGVRLDDAAAWSPDADELDASLGPAARSVAHVLLDGAADEVTVVGHLETGDDPIGVLAATLRRAQVFGDAVIDAGASPDAVRTLGRGDSRPLADSDDEPERNRRIDLVFAI